LKPIINLPNHVPYKVAVKGDAIMLMCIAYGTGKIIYYWEYRISDSDKWIIVSAEMDHGLLILSSVTEDNEGIYRCVACDCYSCSYSIDTTTITLIGK